MKLIQLTSDGYEHLCAKTIKQFYSWKGLFNTVIVVSNKVIQPDIVSEIRESARDLESSLEIAVPRGIGFSGRLQYVAERLDVEENIVLVTEDIYVLRLPDKEVLEEAIELIESNKLDMVHSSEVKLAIGGRDIGTGKVQRIDGESPHVFNLRPAIMKAGFLLLLLKDVGNGLGAGELEIDLSKRIAQSDAQVGMIKKRYASQVVELVARGKYTPQSWRIRRCIGLVKDQKIGDMDARGLLRYVIGKIKMEVIKSVPRGVVRLLVVKGLFFRKAKT